jgi:uncharacterized membrane protein
VQRQLLAPLTLAALALASVQTGRAHDQAEPRYTTITVFGGDVFTQVSINNRRMVTGVFLQPNADGEGSREVGFALQDRFLHSIDFANAFNVVPIGINDRGEIVGLVDFTDRTAFGFRYSRGELKNVDLPGSRSTTPRDINNRGDIVGVTQRDDLSSRGYLLSGDQLTLIAGPDNDGTHRSGPLVLGVNDKREVVGCYELRDVVSQARGFVFRKGTYEVFQVPGAPTTCITSINNRGQLVGNYTLAHEAAGRVHGFLFWKGRYVTMDIPNARQTLISSINDFGDVVGIYQDETFVSHAFQSNVREFIHRH